MRFQGSHMKKIVIHSPGGYEKLQLENHPVPNAGPGEVLIATKAAGVNYADCCVRWGVYASAKKYIGWPITPGFEFSGQVLESNSTRFKPGDSVVGITRFGGYASHIVVPDYQLFFKPKELSYLEAAAFPAVFLTAYHALFHHIHLKKNMNLLIHSAAGGVGSSLVQLAKIHGCRTVGVVGSSHKVEFVRTLGADVVIDKSQQDLWLEARNAAPDGYDLILDANGPETLWQGYQHLRPMGKLIVYGSHTLLPKKGGRINYFKAGLGLLRNRKFDPLRLITENKGVVGFNISFLFDQIEMFTEGMEQLLHWVSEGKIKSPPVSVFALEDVAQAHRSIESGQSIGKLVLSI